MKKKILASLLLTTPFLVLATSCNVATKTSGDKKEGDKNNNAQPSGKPLIRESLTLDQKKEKVKEYFKNYDYVQAGADVFEITITKNEDWQELDPKPDANLWDITNPFGYAKGFIINANIYHFLKDLEWKLILKKRKNSNEIKIRLEDNSSKEIATYTRTINYFLPVSEPDGRPLDVFYFFNSLLHEHIDEPTTTLLSEKQFKAIWLPETSMTNKKDSEKIWNTLKWYDSHRLLDFLNNSLIKTVSPWFNFSVKKYLNENTIELSTKIPLCYFDRNEKGEYFDKTSKEHPRKWGTIIERRTVHFDKLKFQDVAQKLEKINKTTFSYEQFAQVSSEPLEITNDNKETLKEKFGLVLDDSITFDELGPDGKFTIQKVKSSALDLIIKRDEDQKYALCLYQWTLEKNGESYTYLYLMNDFDNESS